MPNPTLASPGSPFSPFSPFIPGRPCGRAQWVRGCRAGQHCCPGPWGAGPVAPVPTQALLGVSVPLGPELLVSRAGESHARGVDGLQGKGSNGAVVHSPLGLLSTWAWADAHTWHQTQGPTGRPGNPISPLCPGRPYGPCGGGGDQVSGGQEPDSRLGSPSSHLSPIQRCSRMSARLRPPSRQAGSSALRSLPCPFTPSTGVCTLGKPGLLTGGPRKPGSP